MTKLESKKIKLRLKKDDEVVVIAGNDKGKVGQILSVDPQAMRAVVKGVNIRTFHRKPTQEKPKGQREKKECAVHISNLMLVTGDSKKPTRVGIKKNEKGARQRYAKKTGDFI
jgi:large subunit ribosomal protein L24